MESQSKKFCNDTAPKKVQVVIVGAGASGLQCAASLLEREEIWEVPETTTISDSGAEKRRNKSPSVLLLEARNRIGGRICTTEVKKNRLISANENPQGEEHLEGKHHVTFHRDLGAAWLHGTGSPDDDDGRRNPMVTLLEEMTLPGEHFQEKFLTPVASGNPWVRPHSVLHETGEIIIYLDGKPLPKESPVISKAIHRHYSMLRQVSDYASELFASGQGMATAYESLAQAMEKIQLKTKTNETVLANHFDETSAVDMLTPFYSHLIECWHGISASNLQLGDFATDYRDTNVMETDELYNHEGDFTGPHCTFTDGMKTVLKPLIKKVGDHIRLNEEVVCIKDCEDCIRLESASGLIVEADCCVVTVSVGCLRRDSEKIYDPPLAADKLEALQAISMGAYKKVFLTFDQIAWPIDVNFLGLIRREHVNGIGKYLSINNPWARKGVPCMEAILTGDAGKWAFQQSDNAIRQAVLDFLREALGWENVHESCTDCHVTRWEEDRFSNGAYSSFHLGTMERHIEALRRSDWNGRLIFAGEATNSEYLGSVHGALISGKSASQAVQKWISSVTEERSCHYREVLNAVGI